ncbi:conserved Plasmodium membrane protein, unknown function [Plasmodium reichenowi]|uniref:Apicoplast integral membrane protein n=1 Tax=Plasmodium reichenowi TaxID=5854 RepID=A0A060RPZ7_PLARE|nr:conserved Plasmodium membrane protein, unknown function [Plasmodium reichenowi]
MKFFVFHLLFILLSYNSFAYVLNKNIKTLSLSSNIYKKNLFYRKKNIRPLKIYVYPSFIKNIIKPLENSYFRNYFMYRSLARICVSLSSAFSLGAKLYLYKKNMNSLFLTQLLMNNEILIKILKICWLYKLSHFIDKNVKLCRYLSTVFYIISIYLDIFSTYNLANNIYIYYLFYSLSSILKSLSILTYTSIRSNINFQVYQMLTLEKKNNEKEYKITNTSHKNNTPIDKYSHSSSNSSVEHNNIHCNDDGTINKNNILNESPKYGHNNKENIYLKNKVIHNTKDVHNNLDVHSELKNTDEEYKISDNHIEKNKLSINTKNFCIGEISVIIDLLSTLVDLSTILFLFQATKFIKQNLCFYIFISSLHLFFSYKEIQYLLI